MATWSFSALEMFEQCPKKYYELKIAKSVKEKPWEHRSDGEAQHEALKLRLECGQPLPEHLKHLEPLCKTIAAAPGDLYLEHKLALDENLEPVEWFSKRVWVRVIFDVAKINGEKALIIDWKTGKKKNNPDQLDIFSAALMAWQPQVTQVTVGFVWTREKENHLDTDIYTREGYALQWSEWWKRVGRIDKAIETNVWQAKPSGLCNGYCPVKSCTYCK